jgi:nitroreductase
VECAVLAPSSHNTQPWRFGVTDSTISLYADRTRALPANDPDDRELTISCGCALMNLRVAGAYHGFRVSCDITPDPGDGDLLAAVSLREMDAGAEGRTASVEELFRSIPRRRTWRRRFGTRDVSESTLKALAERASEEGAWLYVVESEEARHKIAALVSEGDAIQWSNPSWRRELAAWMHPRRRGDGLTVPGLVAPIAQAVVRTFDMGNGVGAKDAQLADESPALAVLGTDGDNVEDWLAAGQALEKVLLAGHSMGLQGSYLNQPVQVASLRERLRELLGLTGFPQIVLRLGFPKEELAASPRRDLDAVLEDRGI